MYKSIPVVIIIMMSAFLAIGQSAEISDQLKANIQSRIDAAEIVGIVVGTTRDGQTSYYTNGVGSKTKNDKVDENSVFEIGSISKTFTGLMLADLVVQGKVNLDDDIQKYLPDGIKAPTKDGKSIKLFHLSNHTSGLPRMPNNFAPSDNLNPFKDYTEALMYEFLNGYELTREIGSQYEYSNFAAGLLGHIVADLNEMTYEELLLATIAQPLGMNYTSVTGAKGTAQGHMGTTEMPNWDFGSLDGAGAIRSTVSDMMLYLSANMGQMESELYSAMQLAHKHSGAEDANTKVGLGWHITTYEDQEIIWHNGQTGGYHSYMGWIKGTDIGVVVLNNSIENIDDIGLNALVASAPLKEVKKTVEVDDSILESYVGQYALAPTFILTVTKEGSQLSVGATGQSAFEVYPKSETTFFYKAVEAELVFKKNENGKVESVTLFQAGREMLAKRME